MAISSALWPNSPEMRDSVPHSAGDFAPAGSGRLVVVEVQVLGIGGLEIYFQILRLRPPAALLQQRRHVVCGYDLGEAPGGGEGQCFNCFAIQLSARYLDTSSSKVSS